MMLTSAIGPLLLTMAALLGSGACSYISRLLGSKWDEDALRDILSYALRISLTGAIIMGLVIGIGARWIVPLFNTEADAEVLRLGILCIRLQCVMLFSHSLGSTINMFYAGIGMARRAMALSISRQGYCYWPVLFLTPYLLGPDGITAVQAIADIIALFVIIPLIVDAFKILRRKIDE